MLFIFGRAGLSPRELSSRTTRIQSRCTGGVFPLRERTEVMPGDIIHCRIDAFLLGEDYTFRWRTRITDGGAMRVEADFDQTTVAGEPLAKERLVSISSPTDP
jgi:hypothetical protein